MENKGMILISDYEPGPKRRRGPTARIQYIKEQIALGKYPGLQQLAKELERNVRSIGRDIRSMKEEHELPIEYDRKKGGYYFTAPVGPIPLMEEELFSVHVAQKVMKAYEGTPLHAARLDSALRKMTGGVDYWNWHDQRVDRIVVKLTAPEEVNAQAMDVLAQALKKNVAVRFRYRNAGQPRPEIRVVRPYCLINSDGRWYVMGRDRKREAIRTFALWRMRCAELTEERFHVPPDFDVEKVLLNSVGVMEGKGEFHVVIEMDALMTDVFGGRKFNGTQQLVELENGGARLTVMVNCLEEIMAWVLGWGTHATVIGPEELRARVGRVAMEVAGRYRGEVESLELRVESGGWGS